MILQLENVKLAIIGLDYIDLPLAIKFGKKHSAVDCDI